MEELSYCARFYFSLALIYTWLAASISDFLTAALNFHVFLPTKFVEKDTTLLLFFLFKSPGGHAISFQTTSPPGRFSVAFPAPSPKPGKSALRTRLPSKYTLSCIWVAIPVMSLLYLSIEFQFYIRMPVVRADGRSGGRAGVRNVTTKISRIHRLPNFLTHGAPLRARESSANNKSKL